MMIRRPVLDLGECSRCEGCIAVCPSVFRMNDAGFIEAADLKDYPQDEVDEAIKNCPEDCIDWEEV